MHFAARLRHRHRRGRPDFDDRRHSGHPVLVRAAPAQARLLHHGQLRLQRPLHQHRLQSLELDSAPPYRPRPHPSTAPTVSIGETVLLVFFIRIRLFWDCVEIVDDQQWFFVSVQRSAVHGAAYRRRPTRSTGLCLCFFTYTTTPKHTHTHTHTHGNKLHVPYRIASSHDVTTDRPIKRRRPPSPYFFFPRVSFSFIARFVRLLAGNVAGVPERRTTESTTFSPRSVFFFGFCERRVKPRRTPRSVK